VSKLAISSCYIKSNWVTVAGAQMSNCMTTCAIRVVLWLHLWIGKHWTGVFVGPTAALDILNNRKISRLCQDSNPLQSSA